MNGTTILRSSPRRWGIIALVAIALILFWQACLNATHQRPQLGVRGPRAGASLAITWVQPAGLACRGAGDGLDGGAGQDLDAVPGSVSYTHLTLPTILRV